MSLSADQLSIEDITDPLTREALGLIWAARRGLSETELLRLLSPRLTQPADLPQLPLGDALQKNDWLVDRDGILNFAHDSLRVAVEAACVPDEDRRDELRLQLADDFERQPVSSRSCDELPWLLLQTESYQRLRQCLLDVDRFLEIKKRDEEELRRYWMHLGEEKSMGELYLASFERWSQLADGDKQRDGNRTSYAANELALFLMHSGLHEAAEPLMRTALDIDTKNLGSNHPFLVIRLISLANLLQRMNRLDEVEGLYRRALSISEQSFGPEHPRVAKCLSNLAEFLLGTNRLDESETLVRRALAVDEKCLGRDHLDVTLHLNLLARILQRRKNSVQAESLVRRSLAILESSFGPDHPNVAASSSNLAFLLLETNRPAEAEASLRRALAINEKSYGLEHTTVGRDLNNLASLLENTDRLAEAEPLYRRAQVIFEKCLGANHPDVGTSLNNLAQLLKKMNRMAEAEPILLRAVQIFLKSTRATRQLDPRLPMAINNYGTLLEAMGHSMAEVSTALREIAPDLQTQVTPRSPITS